MLLIHFETRVRVVTTEIYVEVFIGLELFGEVFLLRNKFFVGFEVFVNFLLRRSFDDLQTVDPSILPIGLAYVFRSTKGRHVQHELLRLRYAISTFRGFDQGGVIMDVSKSGSGDTR